MSQQLFLDPDKVADLEPSEGDDRRRVWLSPFAVPHAIHLTYEPRSQEVRLVFGYTGQEAAAASESLDDQSPRVTIRPGVHTQAVRELSIGSAPGAADFRNLAARLRAAAAAATSPARRLSYQMTAILFESYTQDLIGRLPAARDPQPPDPAG